MGCELTAQAAGIGWAVTGLPPVALLSPQYRELLNRTCWAGLVFLPKTLAQA